MKNDKTKNNSQISLIKKSKNSLKKSYNFVPKMVKVQILNLK